MTTSNQRRKLSKQRAIAFEKRMSLSERDKTVISKIALGIKGKGSVKADGASFVRHRVASQFKGLSWVRKGL